MRLRLQDLKGDVYGGITAAVVALPLALAFGVASGAGPVAGLYGAIFVGFFAAVFGGTPAQVSGPTGPMTVVMAVVVTQYAHEPAMAFTVVMMAGVLQIVFGVLRLGSFVHLMPYPVVSGFMTGIGCIIIIIQVHPFLGLAGPSGGPIGHLLALPDALSRVNPDAFVAGAVALAIVLFTPARVARIAPPPLIALLAGTLAVLFAFPGAPVIGDIPTGLPDPQLPRFSLDALPDMVQSAIVLAVLGSIDSLLTSLIADSVTQTRHDSDRELIGQGIGNTIAGIMGAIPGAGATMRTVVNVRAGGRTPVSGALHALLLLGVMLGLGRYAAYIPQAVLAGILFKVGVDIIDWRYLRMAPGAPRAGVVMMLVVLLLTVLVDLITAVGVGVVMASLLFVKRMADLQSQGILASRGGDGAELAPDERTLLDGLDEHVLLVTFAGPMSFGAANEIGRKFESFVDVDVLVLDFSGTPFVDSSATLSILGVVQRAIEKNQRVIVCGASPAVRDTFRRLGVLRRLDADAVLDRRRDALSRARALVIERHPGAAAEPT